MEAVWQGLASPQAHTGLHTKGEWKQALCTRLGRGVQVGGAALRLGLGCRGVLGLDGLVRMPGLRLEPHLQPLRVHLHILHAQAQTAVLGTLHNQMITRWSHTSAMHAPQRSGRARCHRVGDASMLVAPILEGYFFITCRQG